MYKYSIIERIPDCHHYYELFRQCTWLHGRYRPTILCKENRGHSLRGVLLRFRWISIICLVKLNHAVPLSATSLSRQRTFSAGLLIGLIIARFVSNYRTLSASCARTQSISVCKMPRGDQNHVPPHHHHQFAITSSVEISHIACSRIMNSYCGYRKTETESFMPVTTILSYRYIKKLNLHCL